MVQGRRSNVRAAVLTHLAILQSLNLRKILLGLRLSVIKLLVKIVSGCREHEAAQDNTFPGTFNDFGYVLSTKIHTKVDSNLELYRLRVDFILVFSSSMEKS